MRRRKDGNMLQLLFCASAHDLELRNPVDFVAEELHPHSQVSRIGRKDLNHISVHAESTALEINIIAVVLDLNQLADHIVAVADHPRPQRNHHVMVIDRAAQSVDTGNGGNNDHIAALGKSGCRRMAEFVDIVIDRGILLNISIRLRYIGLRLVIIIITHKILYSIFREVGLHLAVELGGKGLIMRQDQGGLIQRLYHIGHGESLAGTGHAKQGLTLIPLPESLYQSLDCLRLIARRRIL